MTAIPVDGILRLEEKGMFKTLVLISEVGPCRISRIYDNISWSPRIRTKMEILEEAGLITWDYIYGYAIFTLTRGMSSLWSTYSVSKD